MATISKEELLNAVSEMSVMDICELITMMEEKFGVSAAPVAAAMPAAGGAAAPAAAEEQTEFDVILKSFGSNKVGVIKVVREITSLGLKEAKDMVEGVPATLKEAVSKDEAEEIKKKLSEAGAEVEIK